MYFRINHFTEIMHITKQLLLIIGALLLGHILHGQSSFELSPSTIDFSTDCVEVEVGSVIDFSSAADCGGTSAITKERGLQTVFSTEKVTFNYTFDELGEFTLWCNLGSNNTGSATVCINVVETLSNLAPSSTGVPTVGEWGVVILMLNLLIFSTISLSQRSTEEALLA